MDILQEALTEYVRMRRNGLDAKTTLKALRPYIEPLTQQEREQVVDQIRQWEKIQTQTSENVEMVGPFKSDSIIKPIKAVKPAPPESKSSEKIVCMNCGKENRADAVICYSCGQIIEAARGQFDTNHFNQTDDLYTDEYYGPNSALMLEIRDAGQYFELQPQRYDHELIIGRSTPNSAMQPDIDLKDYNASELGVSRLHMSLHYMKNDNVIQVYDLGSSNGSFINGQKLHPKEVRMLRHNDELRMGRFVMRIHFRHPQAKK